MPTRNTTRDSSESIVPAIECCVLNSAWRFLAERLEISEEQVELTAPSLAWIDELAHLPRPLQERCLPLLKQYSPECLDSFGLNMVCQAWEQRVVPASVIAFLSMGNGLYVIGGCRPSNVDVELVVHAGSNVWSHHVSQCRPCKFPENRHVEGLFGCNYGYLCVFRLSVHHVVRQVWVNGFSVPFVVQNLEDAPILIKLMIFCIYAN